MKKLIFSFLLFSSFIVIITMQLNCGKAGDDTMTKAEMVEHGKYLVDFGGCNDCHSPKVMTNMGPMPDTTLLLSGHRANSKPAPVPMDSNWMQTNHDLTAWVGPWGMSFAANLTPDPATGTGNWTEEIFIKAMRTGKHLGTGRDLLPPMPWFNVAGLKDDDLKAVFAYLKSIPAISNKVPDPIPPDVVASTMSKKQM